MGLYPREGPLWPGPYDPSFLSLQGGATPPNTHLPYSTVKASQYLLLDNLGKENPECPMLLAPSLLEKVWEAVQAGVGWRSRDKQGLQALFIQPGLSPGRKRRGSQGSWGSDPTSLHLCAWLISELHMCNVNTDTHTFTQTHVYRCTSTLKDISAHSCECTHKYPHAHAVISHTCTQTRVHRHAPSHVHIHSCACADTQIQTVQAQTFRGAFSLSLPQAGTEDPSGLKLAVVSPCQPPFSSRTCSTP